MRLQSSARLLALPLLLLACASPEEADRWADPPLSSAAEAPEGFEEKLINGRFTRDRPEIGAITVGNGFCTATLIRPDVLVTAAHCVGYGTAEGRDLGVFRVSGDRGDFSYTINAHRAWSQGGVNARDVALVRLATPVPASVAQPTSRYCSRASDTQLAPRESARQAASWPAVGAW